MSSWYDLSKFKETMSAAALTLQQQAQQTAKQYLENYTPDETNQESSSDESPKDKEPKVASYMPPLHKKVDKE